MKKLIPIVLILLMLIPALVFADSFANEVTFSWDANTEEDIAGYKVCHNGQPMFMVQHPQTILTVENVPYGEYTARAYDTSNNESELSNSAFVLASYYNSVRYEYDNSGQIAYKGLHVTHDASEDATDWEVTKYYYTNRLVTKTRTRITSWTNRAVGW